MGAALNTFEIAICNRHWCIYKYKLSVEIHTVEIITRLYLPSEKPVWKNVKDICNNVVAGLKSSDK